MRSTICCFGVYAIIIGVSAGCVTSQKTTGYQTNPPVNGQLSRANQKAANNSQNGMQKFIANLAPNKKQKKRLPSMVDPNDATSLRNRPEISPQLLVVAGKMSIEKHAWESAESYFKRALQADPNNTEAKSGLAVVAEARARGIPNSNISEKQNRPLQTGEELNQALRNLMPNSKPANNHFGISDVAPIESAVQPEVRPTNVMASYASVRNDVAIRSNAKASYPATQYAMPFTSTHNNSSADEIDFISPLRAAKVSNPYYKRPGVMTVAYEEEIDADEQSNDEHTNKGPGAEQKSVKPEPKRTAATELAKLKSVLKRLSTQKKRPTQRKQNPSVSKEKSTVVRAAVMPRKLVIGDEKVRLIESTEAIVEERFSPRESSNQRLGFVFKPALSVREVVSNCPFFNVGAEKTTA